jgi:WXXGXW repeat (2 copies)
MKTKSPLLDHLRTGKARIALLACAGAALALAGCASDPDSHVVSAPPPPATPVVTATTPVAVQTQAPTSTTATLPNGQTIVVTQAPPAAPQDVVTEQPTPRHAWIPGYWTYRDQRYVWIAGHWEVPPRSDAVWVAPRYDREGNAYRFYEGHWE